MPANLIVIFRYLYSNDSGVLTLAVITLLPGSLRQFVFPNSGQGFCHNQKVITLCSGSMSYSGGQGVLHNQYIINLWSRSLSLSSGQNFVVNNSLTIRCSLLCGWGFFHNPIVLTLWLRSLSQSGGHNFVVKQSATIRWS